MSRVVVRPPFLLHPEEIVASGPVDPFATTMNARAMGRACRLLVEATRPESTLPDDLKARALAARTAEELEAVADDLTRWKEHAEGAADSDEPA